MKLFWLRWRYAVEMVNCYLAEMMGEMDVAANHELAASRVLRLIHREMIQ